MMCNNLWCLCNYVHETLKLSLSCTFLASTAAAAATVVLVLLLKYYYYHHHYYFHHQSIRVQKSSPCSISREIHIYYYQNVLLTTLSNFFVYLEVLYPYMAGPSVSLCNKVSWLQTGTMNIYSTCMIKIIFIKPYSSHTERSVHYIYIVVSSPICEDTVGMTFM
jgi:hypothetical protein